MDVTAAMSTISESSSRPVVSRSKKTQSGYELGTLNAEDINVCFNELRVCVSMAIAFHSV